MSTNAVTLSGRLERDPEIRYSREGVPHIYFGLVVHEPPIDGNVAEHVLDVEGRGGLAENVALSVVKGAHVIVTGMMLTRHWETDEGEQRAKAMVFADDIAASMRDATVEITRTKRSLRADI